MGINVIPSKFPTRRIVTLTSGTSWTVPTGVKFVNVTLFGGGGGGGGGPVGATFSEQGSKGLGGQVVSSTLTTTPGASITYALGAGGTGGTAAAAGGTGGTTTFTGATSATGGNGGKGGSSGSQTGTAYQSADNGGNFAGQGSNGGTGGSGKIDVEYWVA
jgi:hypothetical protein